MLERLIIGRNKFIIYVCIIASIASLLLGMCTRVLVEESGTYKDKNHVALYLMQYHKLPGNYISKPTAKTLFGTDGFQPEDGRMIGGDTHSYYGAITEYTFNTKLFECDVNYPLLSDDRGQKRIVYSQDYTEFYYTSNHYDSFSKITVARINLPSDIGFVLFGTIILGGATFTIYIVVKRRDLKDIYLEDLGEVLSTITTALLTIILTPFKWLFSGLQKIFDRH